MEAFELKSLKHLSQDINAKRKLAVKVAELQEIWEQKTKQKNAQSNLYTESFPNTMFIWSRYFD